MKSDFIEILIKLYVGLCLKMLFSCNEHDNGNQKYSVNFSKTVLCDYKVN